MSYRVMAFAMDGHESFRRVENCLLGWGAEVLSDVRLEGRTHLVESLAPTWPFGTLVARHNADGRWYSIHGSIDVLHVKKACVRALRTHARTVYAGDLYIDWSGFLRSQFVFIFTSES